MKKYLKCALVFCAIGINHNASKETYTNPGSNNRMNEFQVILGINQLSNLDKFIKHRINVANWYLEGLKELLSQRKIALHSRPDNVTHSYWMFLVFVNSDDFIRKSLKEYSL